jgi:hypothetical protein
MMKTHQRITPPRLSRGAVLSAAIALGVAVSMLSSASAAAQISIPSITAPKQAAMRAAAATNAQTAAMQNVGSTPTQANPSAPAPQPSRRALAPITASTPPSAAAKPTVAGVAQPTALEGKPAPAVAGATKAVAGTAKPAAGAALAKGASPAGAASTGPGSATVVGDSAGNSISVTQRGVKGEVSLNREVFSYDAGARRDPFISLMRSGDLRPMLSDLRLVAVLYDATGRNSIAVMRDQSNKDQYRVRVGQTLGRMRVMQIQPKQVVFTIEEVGFSRQEALALGDTSKARTP